MYMTVIEKLLLLKNHQTNRFSFEGLLHMDYPCYHLQVNQFTDFMKIRIKCYALITCEFVQFSEQHMLQRYILFDCLIIIIEY